MAKITFVYPDVESLGVEYLMAVCQKDGHGIDFVFYEAEDRYIGVKNNVLSFSAIAKKIADTQPDLVAFSCVTDNYQYQLSCAKAVKEIMPKVVTIFGGVHPTAVPEKVLSEKAVDCVAIGEAEDSLSAFLKEGKVDEKFILSGRPIKGIVYKLKDRLIGDFKEGELSDVDALPFPYKERFYSSLKAFSREYVIMTSRGCPYSCSYCFNSYMRHLRGKSILRQRTVDNAITELLEAKRRHAPKYINFQDDCFTTNEGWITEFCQRYKKEIGLPFRCLSIPEYLTREKIKALHSAGCIRMTIGVQSLDKEISARILHRRSDKKRIAEAICMLKEAGIAVQVDHMLGIPEDTLEIEEESALFYNEFRPHVISVFWLTYYPKTDAAGIARQKNILTEQDIENINDGRSLTEGSYHTGGSLKVPRPYCGICLLLNWLPLLPRGIVRFLVKQKLYQKIAVKNYFFSVYFPRFLLAILNSKNFTDREIFIRFIAKKSKDYYFEAMRYVKRYMSLLIFFTCLMKSAIIQLFATR